MAKMWRVSCDSTGLVEADSEEEAIKQFISDIQPEECTAELENGDDDDDLEEEEADGD